MNIILDDAFQFGLGAFETICLRCHQPMFLSWHLQRINATLQFLGISQRVTQEEVHSFLEHQQDASLPPLHALKIMVSENNKLFTFRDNPYTANVIQQGFRLDYSKIYRNETSPLVFHKTMNYGDNIIEKRRTHTLDIDEVLFLNSRGEICEGSTTNVFFVRDGQIYTPALSCGLLPGIVRRFLLEHFPINQVILHPEDIRIMEECFVTNSLIGIMPVTSLAQKNFHTGPVTRQCMEAYEGYL